MRINDGSKYRELSEKAKSLGFRSVGDAIAKMGKDFFLKCEPESIQVIFNRKNENVDILIYP